MADGPIAGALTFSTTLDNSDLEKGLEEAQGKIEELKNKLEENESNQNAISQKLEEAADAADTTKATIDELRSQIEALEASMEGMSSEEFTVAADRVRALYGEVNTLVDTYEQQVSEYTAIDDKLRDLETEHQRYEGQLQTTEEQARQLQSTLSSAYYQAGIKCREAFTSMSQAASQFGQRIINLAQSTLVFQVFSDAFRTLKQGIGDALMQNEQFSASWTALGATAQGFANGIASVVAPALVSVVNVVTSCIVTMARAIDAVFKTGLVAAINGARSAAQESWRQTDASKAAAKQAEQNAKSRQQQQERYQKAVEQQRKREEASAKRLADAQESAAKRRAAAEQKYPDALEDSAERQTKAEQEMAERRAEAEQTATERQAKAEAKMQERMADAQESAAKRQAKAEESAAARLKKAQESAAKRQTSVEQSNAEKQQAASDRLAKAQETAAKRRASAEQSNAERQQAADERLAKAQQKASERLAKAEATAAQKNADAQAAYEKKVAAAQAKEAANKAKWDEKQAKAAAKLEKAQKKANATVLGFDELNKMNADSSEEAAQATEDLAEYKSTLADIEPPKTYSVDPSDYMIDPSDYAAKLKEIKDYSVDPADYAAKLKEMEDYTVDPSDYFVDPSEYQIDPSDYVIDPSDYAIDYDKYQIDPEDFFVDPEDYTFDPMDYWVDPSDYAVDALEFDWKDFPEISPTEGLKQDWDALDIGKIDSKLAELEAICAGALLAIGAILAFSGINVPLGLALMAAGAIMLADVVAENWDKLPAEVQNAITNALVITGIVLIVLGAILTFSGAAIPLGIGLMVAGALLEWEAIVLNWDSMSPLVQGVVTALELILGAAFLVIGALLVFTGANVPLGIALMAFGALNMVAAVAINWDNLPPQIQSVISLIDAIVSIAFLTIGAILIFSGVNIPLGLGFLAVGAIGLVADIVANWELIKSDVGQAIAMLEAAVGIAFLAIGAVLAFSGANVPLGIGLLAVGALSMGAAITVGWESLPPEIQAVITILEAIIGVAFLVMGAILVFSGANVPLGLGLLAIGAVSMGAAIAQAWDSLPPQVQAVITAIELIVGVAFLAVGALLLFSGTNLPLGFGLLALGAVSMGAALAENWETLPPEVQNVITAIEIIVGTAFLVVGALLTFSGTNVPLGLGLIALGAVNMAAAAIENWEYVQQNVGTVIDLLETALFAAALVIGAILTFSAANAPLGLALMALGAVGMAMEASENWEKLPQDVQNVIATVTAAVSGALLAIGFLLVATAVNLPLGFGLMITGAMGLTTLATLDWSKMPTEVQNTVSKILDIVSTTMLVLGVILCITGVGIPLGIGLILAGAAGLATEAAINWDFLKEKAQKVWEGLKQWWQNGPAKVFTAEFWQNVFKCIGDAFLGIINGIIEWWNDMWAGISDALGSLVGATGGSYEGGGTVSNVRPPGLARGAVIPPNRQFMAVLGDQTSGNNIETPEGLMRQVVREEAGSMMAEMMMQMQALGGGQETGGDTNLALYIDSEELARATAKGTSSLTRRGVLSPSATFV